MEQNDFTKVKPYDYAEGLRLVPSSRPEGELHRQILKYVMDLAETAMAENTARQSSWDAMDQKLRAVVMLSDVEKKLQNRRPDIPVRVAIPYTYATLETLLTYLTMAFLSNAPVFSYDTEYSGHSAAVRFMQDIIQRQVVHYKAPLALYTWFRDGLAYGLGATFPFWQRDFMTVKERVATQVESVDGGMTQGEPTIARVTKEIFAGTKLKNVHPKYLLLDPSKSPHDVQGGAFVGWVEQTNQYALLDMERNNPEEWFNVRYLKYTRPSTRINSALKMSYKETTDDDLKVVYLVNLICTIIPSEVGVPAETEGFEDYPEKWLFTIANDEVVIRAMRLDASHGKYPIALTAPDFDGYSQFPLSRLEISEGLQVTLDWLFNSHIKNVRQAINNRFVVDPMLVNLEDLKNPDQPYIRLAESAWGKSVRDAVYQLGVTDVTRDHIANASSVIDMYQRISGATDGFMGIMRDRGERVSASESRSVTSSGGNRMGKMALLMSFMGMTDIAMFYASNLADYQSMDQYVKISETHPQEIVKAYGLGNTVALSPGDLNVPYHVIPRDGSLPKDQQGIAQSWVQLFSSITGSELLSQKYDVMAIFKYIAKLLGANELPNFEVQGMVMPDEEVAREVERGNAVPVEQQQ